MAFFTKNITTPLVITRTDGVFFVSVEAIGGSVDILGTASFQGMNPDVATITTGNAWNFSNSLGEGAIEVTITPSATAAITIGFNS